MFCREKEEAEKEEENSEGKSSEANKSKKKSSTGKNKDDDDKDEDDDIADLYDLEHYDSDEDLEGKAYSLLFFFIIYSHLAFTYQNSYTS